MGSENQENPDLVPRFKMNRDDRPKKYNITDFSDERKLFVGQLPRIATREEVAELFAPFGVAPEDVKILAAPSACSGQQHRGCAFVRVATDELGHAAIARLHTQITLRGVKQPLQVRWADGTKLAQRHTQGDDVPLLTTENHIQLLSATPHKVHQERLFVGQVPHSCTEKDILQFFCRRCSPEQVVRVELIRDRTTRKPRGAAFVTVRGAAVANRLIEDLHGRVSFPSAGGPGSCKRLQVRFSHSNYANLQPGKYKLFVGQVGISSAADLEQMFSFFGRVLRVHTLPAPHQSGFVEFENRSSAFQAIERVSGHFRFAGATSPTSVRFAENKEPQQPEFKQMGGQPPNANQPAQQMPVPPALLGPVLAVMQPLTCPISLAMCPMADAQEQAPTEPPPANVDPAAFQFTQAAPSVPAVNGLPLPLLPLPLPLPLPCSSGPTSAASAHGRGLMGMSGRLGLGDTPPTTPGGSLADGSPPSSPGFTTPAILTPASSSGSSSGRVGSGRMPSHPRASVAPQGQTNNPQTSTTQPDGTLGPIDMMEALQWAVAQLNVIPQNPIGGTNPCILANNPPI